MNFYQQRLDIGGDIFAQARCRQIEFPRAVRLVWQEIPAHAVGLPRPAEQRYRGPRYAARQNAQGVKPAIFAVAVRPACAEQHQLRIVGQVGAGPRPVDTIKLTRINVRFIRLRRWIRCVLGRFGCSAACHAKASLLHIGSCGVNYVFADGL